MKINVFSIAGKAAPAWDFKEAELGKSSQQTLAQAIFVYQSNSHQKTSAAKTRSEVVGSTKKIYRQKGTGNARHGAKYAPIFVGGGVAHGPKSIRPENLKLSKAMRRRALATALLLKLGEQTITGLKDVSKATGKTASAVTLLSTIANHPKNKVLLVTKNEASLLFRMVRSLQGVTMKRASLVNAYDLVSHDSIILTKPAFELLVARTKKPEVTTTTKVKQ